MKVKNSIKQIWLGVGVISIVLLMFHWFGYGQDNLANIILVLNVLALVLSLPCSLFAIPVVFTANYYLDLHPTTSEGIYLNTFLLFALGALQWFLVIRFWMPAEPIMQKLNLSKIEAG